MKYSKKISILLFIVGCFSSAKAQNFKATDPIAVNQKIKKGVLPNGMTYYIYPTDVNKNTASYYIIQNVGSILENDQQKGLAHFLEHMAFNGTKHFEGKGILNTLQKQGAVFGKNINAYTSTDETVYNLDNIPSKDGSVVDTCLLVLHDWSNFLSLTNEEIDAERGVITEEWRTRQNARARIYNQLAPYYYNNSLYADRMPIGDMEIVKNFKYQVLKDFYKDWYRPDLQAIAIVGDINSDEIEAKIKKLFADIPTPQNPKQRFEIAIPEKEEPTFKLALDKEISASNISFMIRHTAEKPTGTFVDLEKSTEKSIAFSILNNRLAELAQKQECPFKSAQIGYQNYSRLNDIWILNVSPKPEKQAEAFAAVMNEWVRAYKFGFSKGEIERAVTETISGYENYLEKLNEISHKQVIEMVKDDYLDHEIIADPKVEFEMTKSILKSLDSKILQDQIAKLYTKQNRVITVTGVEGEENLSQEKAFDIIQKAENDASLQPYVDTFEGKTLLGNLKINSGKIVSEKKETAIDATTFVLSNGVKVHYKFADKNKKEVELKAESFGGTSLYEPQDLPSIGRATVLAMMSGVGELSNVDLEKVLKGKIANSSVSISSLKETVSGSANVKDIETMMQLVHLRFVQPRFDNQMYALLKQRLENSLKNRANDINAKMEDSLSAVVYGKNNPRVLPFNQKYIDDLSFDKMKSFYQDRFADVSNFEFYIVGDISPEVLKPLLEKYIASINGIKRKEKFKTNVPKWVSNKIDRDIFIKMETPKSSVRIAFLKDCAFTQKNRILASYLGDILTLRYTESLREKEGGTYGAGVKAGIDKLPISKVNIQINFDCDADKVEHLLPIVYQEIDKIKKGEIAAEDIEKTRTNYLKSREDSKNFNSYSMNLIYNYFENDYNMNDPKNYVDIVKSITAKDIQEFAVSVLDKADAMEVVFKPLK
ncbi:zinc protease [Flavobacterium resistens]|uniref:Insulinase family protein n=1 Tax=Flavobacterium resistens TaxID=443612 RepID=A0A521DLR5_9FLAO|nr:M16 family metallopeptidase [Flavobacterium resistens]MRX68366.1 insulinase family protein [Flavobacterium resistens]SMO72647.1 zinc protease [Flavobacterium resistens]